MAGTPVSAKATHQVRDKTIVKMEHALSIWIEDRHKKAVPFDSNIKEKARSLYERLKMTVGGEGRSATISLNVSKGWFDNFKCHFSLLNVKLLGELTSANHVATAVHPDILKILLEENGYKPEKDAYMDLH